MWPSTLMLLPYGIVLGMGILFAFLLARQAKLIRARGQSHPDLDLHSLLPRQVHYRPTPFDHPCRWLAVRSSNAAAVQSALALDNPTPCCWPEILLKLSEHKLFIAPPVSGWTLVMGQALPEPSEDVDECFHFVRHLSGKIGQVEFFSVNRVLGHHAWVRAMDGRILRAYAWAGETLWNQGEPTAAELELGLKCFAYGEKTARTSFGSVGPAQANAEKIFSLAARWSVDPAALDELVPKGTRGIAGDRSQFRSY